MPSRTATTIFFIVLFLAVAGAGIAFGYLKNNSKTQTAHSKGSGIEVNEVQAFILPISEPNYLPIRDYNVTEPDIRALSAGLYDVASGRLIYDKHADDHLPIASLTKLMSAVIIRENLNLDDPITVFAEDLNIDGHGADLFKDEIILGHNLLSVMLITSSNDAAFTFASAAKKKGIDFVAKMNEKARELGMNNTQFRDPAGLDDSGFSTVNDLIKLALYINRYPDIWDILKTKVADAHSIDGRYDHHLIATDLLLGKIPFIIGGKTGYTDKALGTMVLEVSRRGEADDALISVILGAQDRFGMTERLIDWAGRGYRWK